MEKEKQIEEMIKITDSHNCPKGQCFKFGYSCNRCKIETVVNAGYGNVKEAAREAYKQARKETFMEIMETLRFGYELPIDDIMHEIAKEYGVEVEE